MYLDSIVCNLGVMFVKGDLSTAFDGVSLASLAQGPHSMEKLVA